MRISRLARIMIGGQARALSAAFIYALLIVGLSLARTAAAQTTTAQQQADNTATANGVDLMQEPLMVKDGEEVKGVSIVISPDVSTLTGRVLVAKGGSPARGAGIMLVPAEPHKQRIRIARLYGLTNADGGFTLTGAPGEYVAVVMRPGGDPYSLSDDVIKARAAGAQRVTLHPGERKNMDFIAPVSSK